MREPKTVFILGAGFSISSGIPKQDDLLKSINNYYADPLCKGQGKKKWKAFLVVFNQLFGSDVTSYLIEDIFTIFDNCIINEESYRGENYAFIKDVYNYLLESIRYY